MILIYINHIHRFDSSQTAKVNRNETISTTPVATAWRDLCFDSQQHLFLHLAADAARCSLPMLSHVERPLKLI